MSSFTLAVVMLQDTVVALPLHAFRTIPTYVARMFQKTPDACAIVVLVQALQGVSHGTGHVRDTGGTIAGGSHR